jgi:hypothetical protein
MKNRIWILVLTVLLFSAIANGQVDTTANSYAVADTQDVKVTLFNTDDLFNITLAFDISTYKKNKSDQEYLDAVLTYFHTENDSVVKHLKVRARGNIRRTAICDFPPLMLNFKMKDSKGIEFSGINKLKIVPYCKEGFEDLILREYLVYKLYNVLTDQSFRVRLFRIKYINTARDRKPITQYGFAIEPKSLVEKRTASKEIVMQGLSQKHFDQEVLTRVALFNYMIGNTDWSVPIQHNILLLRKVQPAFATDNPLIPYDFDYSAIVGAPYAIPFETLPIKTVRERMYLAICRSEASFSTAIDQFSAKKDQFYKVINDFPYLSARSKKDMTKYLDDFFWSVGKRNYLVKKLIDDCTWFEEHANLKVRK